MKTSCSKRAVAKAFSANKALQPTGATKTLIAIALKRPEVLAELAA